MRTRCLMVMLLALAVGALWPLRASATILPLCETQEAASMPSPPEPTCESGSTSDDEIGDSSVAPMCDLRGASIVAPPRILPVDDVRIEVGRRSCGESLMAPSLSPRSHESPVQTGAASTELMTLASLAPVTPPSDSITVHFIAGGGEPRAGVSRDVYHPPR